MAASEPPPPPPPPPPPRAPAPPPIVNTQSMPRPSPAPAARPMPPAPPPPPCGAWSLWSDCTATCGGGSQKRTREGPVCQSNAEVQACGQEQCPFCSNWGPYDRCSASCGGGMQTRMRSGTACVTTLESQECNIEPCPDKAPSPPMPPGPTPMGQLSTTAEPTTTTPKRMTSTYPADEMVDIVEMRLSIDADFDLVAGDIVSFTSTFRQGMADTLAVDPQSVVVVNVLRGSVIVDFRILSLPGHARGAEESANRLEGLMAASNYDAFPQSIRPHMKNAQLTARMSRTLPFSEAMPAATADEGYAAPSGCQCVSNMDAGIIAGCSQHLGLTPAWCLVTDGCSAARPGSHGSWAYCVKQDPPDEPDDLLGVTSSACAASAGFVVAFQLFAEHLLAIAA
eukprot:gnl/TRDRNA2_/TRDRNA2_84215_c0_seq1.p1 gnl/TRDRNA2_/TRDRNA2_84215_c0~~gnl/TRDRNA2_/TRDRNA2_84215_c0_seq1.p1  ORF type:complete len:453 (-),score=55.66 gnl/TRDRNA2_/TRDRNA2_84215_c0_seq1:119-1306(-)